MAAFLKASAHGSTVYRKQFPTGTWLEVKGLALPEFMIEIELEAHGPKGGPVTGRIYDDPGGATRVRTGERRPCWRRAAWPALRIAGLLVVVSAIMLVFERKLIYFRSGRMTSCRASSASPSRTSPSPPRTGCGSTPGTFRRRRAALDGALRPRQRRQHQPSARSRPLPLVEAPCGVLLFEYPGYGRSEGSPDEEGTYRDARAAHRWLVEDKRSCRPLVIFGESLGSAVALDLALSRPSRAPPSSRPSPPSRPWPGRHPFLPLWPFVRTRDDNEAKVPGLAVPLLVLHGDRDEVSFSSRAAACSTGAGAERFSRSPARRQDTYLVGGEAYWGVVRDFLEALPGGRRGRAGGGGWGGPGGGGGGAGKKGGGRGRAGEPGEGVGGGGWRGGASR